MTEIAKIPEPLPRIVTASWSTALPTEFVRIGISRGAPRGHPPGYRVYRGLAPGPWFKSVSDDDYVRRYDAEVLSTLNVTALLTALLRISSGAPFALLCFERCGTNDGWCHRGLVSNYFERVLGLEIYEFGFERLGYGRHHPMLPPVPGRRSST